MKNPIGSTGGIQGPVGEFPPHPGEFTFVWIPDIHLERSGQPQTWTDQANWIATNQAFYNIQAVFCAGDMEISNWPSGGQDDLVQDLPPAWTERFSAIDGMGVPWLVAVGNHDFDDYWDTTSFDLNMGYSKIGQKPWYAGYWPAPGSPSSGNPGTPPKDANLNPSKGTQAILFAVNNRQVLVVAPEMAPRQGALDWAGGVIQANPQCDVIVLAHGYMQYTGQMFDENTPLAGASYTDISGQTVMTGSLTGTDIQSWLHQFPNARLVLCGHSFASGAVTGPCSRHWIETATNGHPVAGILADYQNVEPVSSQVVLLVTVSGSQVSVRAFNTSTGEEQFGTNYVDGNGAPQVYSFPFTLPWGTWPLLQPNSFQALSANEILVLGSNGNLWLEQAPFGPVPPERQQVDANVQGFQALSETEVVVLDLNGYLWLEQAPFGTVPPQRAQIDAAVTAFQALDASNIAALGSDGKLWMERGPFGNVPPARTLVAQTVQAFQALDEGQVFVLNTGGGLGLALGLVASPAASPAAYLEPSRIDDDVQRFQALSVTEVVVLGEDGNLWLEQAPFGTVPPARQQIDGGVQGFQALSATEIVVLRTDGTLWLESAPFGTASPTRVQIDADVM